MIQKYFQMQLLNVSKTEQGFTLIEGITIVVMVGILAAIGGPSLIGLLNRAKVEQATEDFKIALVEASRKSKEKACSVEFELKLESYKVFSNDGCLLSQREFPKEVKIASNITGEKLNFTLRGDIDRSLSTGETIVLYNQGDSYRKCMVISDLGFVKIGNYQGSTSGTISETYCKK
jgi:type II secretory pathway pseudopilin PulG